MTLVDQGGELQPPDRLLLLAIILYAALAAAFAWYFISAHAAAPSASDFLEPARRQS